MLAAAYAGRRFFGLEAGGECRSSNDINQATSLGRAANPTLCSDAPLNGLPSGGPSAFNLYEMSEDTRSTITQPYAYGLNGGGAVMHHGCFRDDGHRISYRPQGVGGCFQQKNNGFHKRVRVRFVPKNQSPTP